MLSLGRHSVDLQEGTVTGPKGEVHLTDIELALVQRLARTPGETVETDVLQQDVWGLAPGTQSRVVRIAAWRLRRKLEEDPGQPVHLLTEHGIGLRLVVEREPEPMLGTRVPLTDGWLDLRTGALERLSGTATLSSQELALVAHLARNGHRQVDRQELSTEVLGYAPTTRSRALDSAVARLRQKLEPNPAHPVHLLTVHGVGYRWAAATAEPPPENPLIGRGPLLAELRERSSRSRWVTMYGAGGVGKTALARALTPSAWVDLDPVEDRAGLIGALASALEIALDEPDPVAQLSRALRTRTGLVVLDGATRIARELREVLPRGPTWLVTSRSPIGHPDEQAVPVPELDTTAAATLLARQARSLGAPHPSWRDDDALAGLAEALEGLPLALMLAAGRSLTLSVPELRERLGTPGLLSQERGPERHRSLEAAISWSYDLLEESERRALEQLSTCAGFDLTAAEALLEEDAIDRLQRLCELHLVRRDEGRYQLPRRVRVFAGARQRADDMVRHARWYATELERRTAGLGLDVTEPGWAIAELGNLRLAIRNHPDRAAAARIAIAIARLRGFAVVTDSADLLGQAIDDAERAGDVVVASVARSVLSTQVGPLRARQLLAVDAPDPWSQALQDLFGSTRGPDAWPDLERSARGLARMQALGHGPGTLDARLIHLNSLLSHERFDEAAGHLDAALLEARELGDRRGLGIVLALRGGGMPELDALLHDYDTAIPNLEGIGDRNAALRVRMLRSRALGRLHLEHEPFAPLHARIEATGLEHLVQRARIEEAVVALAHGDPTQASALAERTATGLHYPEGWRTMEALVLLLEGAPTRALAVLERTKMPIEAPLWRLLARFLLNEPVYDACLEHLAALESIQGSFVLDAHRIPFVMAVTHALAAQQAPTPESREHHLDAADRHGAGIPRWLTQAAAWRGAASADPHSPEHAVLHLARTHRS